MKAHFRDNLLSLFYIRRDWFHESRGPSEVNTIPQWLFSRTSSPCEGPCVSHSSTTNDKWMLVNIRYSLKIVIAMARKGSNWTTNDVSALLSSVKPGNHKKSYASMTAVTNSCILRSPDPIVTELRICTKTTLKLSSVSCLNFAKFIATCPHYECLSQYGHMLDTASLGYHALTSIIIHQSNSKDFDT